PQPDTLPLHDALPFSLHVVRRTLGDTRRRSVNATGRVSVGRNAHMFVLSLPLFVTHVQVILNATVIVIREEQSIVLNDYDYRSIDRKSTRLNSSHVSI